MAEMQEIDDSLYSRQRYVLGDTAMHKLANSDIFVTGLGGLGLEIAKNVILAGVKSLTIHDARTADWSDLSSQYYLTEEDIRHCTNRAHSSLSKLRELNPYVEVKLCDHGFGDTTDFHSLGRYNCIVICDYYSMDFLQRVDEFCRTYQPPIRFIMGNVYGIFSYGFCDFGTEFEVIDSTGEDPVEFNIGNISKSCPAVVACLENERHGLEDGDLVEIVAVEGMTALNGKRYTVKVLSPYEISIDEDTSRFLSYKTGGVVRQIKTSHIICFEPLSKQLVSPTFTFTDFGKVSHSSQTLLALSSLDEFYSTSRCFPTAWSEADAKKMCEIAVKLNERLHLVDTVDLSLISLFSNTLQGCMPPLVSTLGGVLAQECLIALTGKFSPLKQWIFLDTTELDMTKFARKSPESFGPKEDRYTSLRLCVGELALKTFAGVKLFMIGCGAIGCEMLKNYSMLGMGCNTSNGKIFVTDDDTVEKSNLNRQFLFRSHHIQKMKSVVAAEAIKEMNPDLSVQPDTFKVYPGTEEKVYNDTFFEGIDVVVNALDSVEARRYVDSRCITNLKPLLESGTMGTKGHVQVIIPEATESYSSQQDPPEKDIPYCTLKSFPSKIEHTIQWARDKFEALFTQKPTLYMKFWKAQQSPKSVLDVIDLTKSLPEEAVKAVKLLRFHPCTWEDCIIVARTKFEKYYNHKAQNLLHAFPHDQTLSDGSPFWQPPKRPPLPLQFSRDNALHIQFVTSFARLFAEVYGIHYSEKNFDAKYTCEILEKIKLPPFVLSDKHIETDESAKKPVRMNVTVDEVAQCRLYLKEMADTNTGVIEMFPLAFEKDSESNGHIDFITAASNLRALMYGIEVADRLKTKKIAGRIIPAIATTTTAIAGLVSIELVKVILGLPVEKHRNAFMNLGLSDCLLVMSEPAPASCMVVREGVSYNLWTRWEVKGDFNMTLHQFLDAVKVQYEVEPTMVVYGVKMVYVPLMPGHKNRLAKRMLLLLKGQDMKYADLTVTFKGNCGNDVSGPPVRYYFQ